MSGTREENIFMARLADRAERYEDMVNYMKRVAKMGTEMTTDERNLLSVAFKNAVGARRHAWRTMSICIQEAAVPEDQQLIGDYRMKVEQELNNLCTEILNILTTELTPKATMAESQVFYMKMTGDYYRYLAEFAGGEDHANYAQQAYAMYEEASNIATQLPPAHHIRLGLALNFSVFYYEVYSGQDMACRIAKEALDLALSAVDQGTEDDPDRKDSIQIMDLLQQNLRLWTESVAVEGNQPPPPLQDGTAVEEL